MKGRVKMFRIRAISVILLVLSATSLRATGPYAGDRIFPVGANVGPGSHKRLAAPISGMMKNVVGCRPGKTDIRHKYRFL